MYCIEIMTERKILKIQLACFNSAGYHLLRETMVCPVVPNAAVKKSVRRSVRQAVLTSINT